MHSWLCYETNYINCYNHIYHLYSNTSNNEHFYCNQHPQKSWVPVSVDTVTWARSFSERALIICGTTHANLSPVGKQPTPFRIYSCVCGCVYRHTHATSYLLWVSINDKNTSLSSSILFVSVFLFTYIHTLPFYFAY